MIRRRDTLELWTKWKKTSQKLLINNKYLFHSALHAWFCLRKILRVAVACIFCLSVFIFSFLRFNHGPPKQHVAKNTDEDSAYFEAKVNAFLNWNSDPYLMTRKKYDCKNETTFYEYCAQIGPKDATCKPFLLLKGKLTFSSFKVIG